MNPFKRERPTLRAEIVARLAEFAALNWLLEHDAVGSQLEVRRWGFAKWLKDTGRIGEGV